ncbi:Transposon Tf2-9 poly [Paramuricea clavata]|uniref:Transposon Tf2-9 poly n=1 Tax=Paramuricea clavata TaxID=317549 RepID=A0A6S7K5W2_PARCT|nr:Transposon Tf2-9 poly [Paramuricea clavata]
MEYLEYYKLITVHHSMVNNSKPLLKKWDFITSDRVTLINPKAQGQVENFNKLINKTTKIACEEGIEIESAIYDMLQAYRQTPHPATKSTPYEVLMHRQVQTRLEHFPTEVHITQDEIKKNDKTYKQKLRSCSFDKEREEKEDTYTVRAVHIRCDKHKRGSTIRARRVKDGKVKCRDASKVKPLRTAQLSKANDETASVKVPSSYQATTSRTTSQDTDGSNIQDTTSETIDTTSETTATTSETTATTSENNL